MSEKYTYTDRTGDRLTIQPCVENAETAFLLTGNGVDIPAADLPGVVAEMYRAAGQESPIILPRYGADVTMTRRGKVRASLIPSGEDMEFTEARHLASWYATAADLAEAEAEAGPSQEEIAHLASVMHDAAPWLQSWLPRSAAETAARAILRAGYAKTGGAS